jgi:hypothetical protein
LGPTPVEALRVSLGVYAFEITLLELLKGVSLDLS